MDLGVLDNNLPWLFSSSKFSRVGLITLRPRFSHSSWSGDPSHCGEQSEQFHPSLVFGLLVPMLGRHTFDARQGLTD
jgi:hypothetical protein